MSSYTTNYSSACPTLGLIMHTTITIGYDVPWQQVHELLLAAALASEGILADPKPFVLQTSLDDYYVSVPAQCLHPRGQQAGRHLFAHSPEHSGTSSMRPAWKLCRPTTAPTATAT